MRLLAIDPGHTCGIATLRVESGNARVIQNSVRSVSPGHVYALLEKAGNCMPDIVVCEEFRLYPWMASHLGFSDFRTCEIIGVIKYLTALNGLTLYMQQSNIKKEARHLAEAHGWKMVVRTLGSGGGKYRGPDFHHPGQQHGRDALAHGVHWAWRNDQSPAYEG